MSLTSKRARDSIGDTDNRRRQFKVSRACDNCKSKKIRCTGTLPCAICARRHLNCTYASKYARGRPPTPQPGATPAQPEQGQEPNRERSLSPERPTDQSVLLSPESEASRDARETVAAADDGLPSRASPELVIEGQYFDLTSGLTFLHRAWRKILVQRGTMASHGSNEAEKNQLLASAGDRPFDLSGGQHLGLILHEANARELVNFYFDSCVVTYRMFHRQTVESWLALFLDDPQRRGAISRSLGNAKCAILLTIMAIARLRMEKIQRSGSAEREQSGLRDSDCLFHAALELTDTEIGFPRLESVQARLIQVLYLLQTSRMNKAWYTLGHACQIISSLGLHRRGPRKQAGPLAGCEDYINLQCVRRVFWVTYTIDKYLSVVFGRPRFLHDDDIDQEFPDLVNDEDMGPQGPMVADSVQECHIQALMLHVKIARIIGRISREVYSVAVNEDEDRVCTARRLAEEVRAWRATLPPHLGTVRPSALIPSFRREAIALQLAYSHALIHANRPFLLAARTSFGGDQEVERRVDECIRAAKEALEMVNSMADDSNLLHAFWWMHYVIFCALTVVYVWEIQGGRVDRLAEDNGESFHTRLYGLAEGCLTHLLQAGSTASPSRRYGVVLEELKTAAQRQMAGNNNSLCVQALAESRDQTLFPNIQLPGQSLTETLSSQANTYSTPVSSLDAWQYTNWLDFDSSVFDPILSDIDLVASWPSSNLQSTPNCFTFPCP